MTSTKIYQQRSAFLLSHREVAELFGVVPVTVRRWERLDILTPIKINARTVRYHPDEVMKLMEASP